MFPRVFYCLSILLLVFLVAHSISKISFADEIDDLQKQIDSLNKAREMSVAATKPLEGQLSSLRIQLAQIQNSLIVLTNKIDQKEKDLALREDKIAVQQALLNQRVKSYYVRSYLSDPFLVIFSSGDSGKIFQELSYRQAATIQDQKVITNVTQEMVNLLADKEQLEKDKAKLAAIKVDVDKNASFLNGEITKAKAYQADLSNQIASLSAKQTALIAAKLASLNISRSAASLGGCTDDRPIDPGFSPRFAFFTYGVPNRVGMNQWGAYGRAQAGQNVEQILSAYYQNYELKKDYNTGVTIKVSGTNEYGQTINQAWNIEDYLKHVYEMPTNWSMEALKAQAVAARSYALAYTNNGSGSICPSQSCQVAKQEENSDSWKAAVDATKGWVMLSGGSPVKAWFSSTHGGYVFSSGDIGWNSTPFTKHAQDTSGSVSNFSDLNSSAYDKNSPWFYCDWGSRPQYSKTAWLKSDEVADIVNVILLSKKDSSTQNHLAQLDKPNPDGTDTWDGGRVRDELKSRGGSAYSNVSDISVGWDPSSGRATSVQVSGDGGTQSIDGSSFKSYFNLRAPANIQIVGPLYNVEKR